MRTEGDHLPRSHKNHSLDSKVVSVFLSNDIHKPWNQFLLTLNNWLIILIMKTLNSLFGYGNVLMIS